MDRKLLGIYLNDHLAGSALGRSLALRISKSHGSGAARREAARLTSEIDDERRALLAMMGRLGIRPKQARQRAAPMLERLGRLKLNGSLVRRSPLSDLVELEGMSLGVNGKLRMWQALRAISPGEDALDESEIDRLVELAEAQIARLDALRLEVTPEALR